MMEDVPTGLIGYEPVVAEFGGWPTFHDAEITNVILCRRPLSAELHLAALGRHQRLVHIELSLEDLGESLLEGFNHQNALLGIELATLPDSRIKVELFGANGLGGWIECRRVRVQNLSYD